MAELSAKHPARSATAKRQRHEQIKRWKEDETSRASTQPRSSRAENRVKFEEGVIFLAATASDDEDEVRRLLKEGSDVNFANVDGLTALHQCCIDDNEDMIRLLLAEGANIDRMDNEGWTPLHAAASSGNMSIVKLLVEKGANAALANNEGELPLDLAEEEEVKEYLEKVVETYGIDVEQARNAEEWTMLEDVEKLLECGEAMGEATGGATALHVACAKGYLHVINLLLQAGVEVNSRDRDGWTPLHACAHWDQMTAAEMVITAGARFDIMTYAGESPEDLVESDEQRKKLLEMRRRIDSAKRTGSMARNKPGDVFEAMQRIRTDSMMKRRTSITRMKKDIAGKRDISQERNIQESFNETKRSTSNGSPLRDDGSSELQKPSPALLRRNGLERSSSREFDTPGSVKPLGSGASKAFANLLNSPIGFRKHPPKGIEDGASLGTESSTILPYKATNANTDDTDSDGIDGRQSAMTVNKPGLYGVHTDESVTGVGVSPLSKRPAERDSGNGAVESVAAARLSDSLPVVSPSRSGVNEENEKLPEAKRRDKAKQKRQKRRPTQPVSVSDVQEARDALEEPESGDEDVESTPAATQPKEPVESSPTVTKSRASGSEMMRRKKARKSREDRPQTGGSELFQALKEAVDAKNNETNDNGDDLESLKVSDEEQEEKEEDLEDEEAPERNKTSLKQSAFKPRARPKPKLFVDEPNNAEQVSSKRREPEGSSGDSSAVAVKQQVDRLQDPGTSQASNPSSPRRQPKRYISKGSEKSGQRRGTGYIWDAQSSGNQGEGTRDLEERIPNTEQQETEPRKKTVVTRTVTRKYVKKPRRPTGPVDADELKESSVMQEGHGSTKQGMAERTGGDGVNGSTTTGEPTSSQMSGLSPRLARSSSHQSSSSPERSDYKQLFEEERTKYDKLKEKYLQSQLDVRDLQTQLKQAVERIEEMRSKYETERRERKALEARLEEIERISSEVGDASKQIAKLKDENAALIRVIGKLSRSTPT
ncbi:protein phosphatase 1 regulatory subunit 12B-like isoform X2 [Corticium candelabrum]|uniref:protein phosphatase 1 regulatory subunit 12B-like isoform X2 n=1 Tax=Corticium candelabrum TaxID=121492 RepID=UPI002E25CA1F|nr:protein phosphatase 1 regulatory subunit 12B-like isoform X2 [Corticium candelabrum]